MLCRDPPAFRYDVLLELKKDGHNAMEFEQMH